MTDQRPPLPPFTRDSAIRKVRMAEDAWNSRDAERVSLGYTPDSAWRNRDRFITGRPAIIAFLKEKWAKETDYHLIKQMWAFDENRIAVRFQYEWRDGDQWYRAHGNELWAFDDHGLMYRRDASINDIAIDAGDRMFLWDAPGPRPEDHPGLEELGL